MWVAMSVQVEIGSCQSEQIYEETKTSSSTNSVYNTPGLMI